jgi:y4mF family transcriptional regulator
MRPVPRNKDLTNAAGAALVFPNGNSPHWSYELSAKIIPIGKTARCAGDIGCAIRDARKERGLTQLELARLCGVGPRFISELENGKPTVQLERALHVLTSLDIAVGLMTVSRPR